MTIYIGNLSFQATEDDLREVFAEYGTVSRVALPIDRESGKKRGFAFVEMETEDRELPANVDSIRPKFPPHLPRQWIARLE